MKRFFKDLFRTKTTRKQLTRQSGFKPQMEALEDRLVLSWSSVPPATITLPTSSRQGLTEVTLNNAGDAQGTATILLGEVDFYKFTAPTSGLYGFAAGSSQIDTVLGVYSASGGRMAYNDNFTSGTKDSAISPSFGVNLKTGTQVYLGVTNKTGTATPLVGNYAWSIDGPSDDAFEQNDSLSQGYDFGTLISPKTLSNLIMRDGQDWFKFTTVKAGTSADAVSISFTNSQGNLNLELYDANSVRLGSAASTTNNSEQISLNGRAAGTYYVKVIGVNGATNPNYALQVNPPVVPDDAFEAIGTTPYNLGTLTQSRFINSLVMKDGQDWFSFKMNATGTNLARVGIIFSGTLGNLDLELYNDSGTLLASGTHPSTEIGSELISLEGRAAATYFVKVLGVNGAANPNYTLCIAPGVADDGYEQNNDTSHARDLGTLTAPTTHANLVMADGQDWFKFTMNSAGNSSNFVSITHPQVPGLAPMRLYLKNSDGATVGYSLSVDALPAATNDTQSIPLQGLPAGTYSVNVVSYNHIQVPTRALVSNYSMTINPGFDDSFEDNDSKGQAHSFGTLTDGRLFRDLVMADGQDWFSFRMDGAGTSASYVNIDFSSNQGNLNLELYGSGSMPIGTSNNTTNDFERISLDGLAPGTYFIKVLSSANNPNYDLTIHEPGLAPPPPPPPPPPALVDDLREDNDSISEAFNLGTPTGWYDVYVLNDAGHIRVDDLVMADSEDWFRFELRRPGVSGDHVRIHGFQNTDGNLDLQLFDDFGDSIAFSEGTTDAETISLNGRGAGIYYFKVYGRDGATNPHYELDLRATNQPTGRDSYEGNDELDEAWDLGTILDARTIGLGHQFNTDLYMGTDLDYFRFDLWNTGTSDAHVYVSSSSQMTLRLSLYNASGTRLSFGTSLGLVDRPAGTYYVGVSYVSGELDLGYTLDFGA